MGFLSDYNQSKGLETSTTSSSGGFLQQYNNQQQQTVKKPIVTPTPKVSAPSVKPIIPLIAKPKVTPTPLLKITPTQKKIPLEQLGKLFPQTKQAVQELIIDPLSLKANPKKAVNDAWEAIKQPVIELFKRTAEDYQPSKTITEKISKKVKRVTGAVNVMFSPINALFAAGNNIPVVGSFTKLLSVPFITLGETAPKVSNKLIDSLPISNEAKTNLKPAVAEVFTLASQIALAHFMNIATKKAGSTIKKVGIDTFEKITKDMIQTSKTPQTVIFNSKDLRGLSDSYTGDLLKSLKLTTEQTNQIRKAALTGENVQVQINSPDVIRVIDKPYWEKIKGIFKMEKTDKTISVPGEKTIKTTKISGLLGDGEHTSSEVIGKVISSGAEKTPEGKALVKQAVEAQNKGQNITISKPQPPVEVVSGDNIIVEFTGGKQMKGKFIVEKPEPIYAGNRTIQTTEGRPVFMGEDGKKYFIGEDKGMVNKIISKINKPPVEGGVSKELANKYGGKLNPEGIPFDEGYFNRVTKTIQSYKDQGYSKSQIKKLTSTLGRSELAQLDPTDFDKIWKSLSIQATKEVSKITPPLSPTVEKLSGGEAGKGVVKPQEVSPKPKRGEITTIEKRINELVGFQQGGENFKIQYHIRNAYIDEALQNAPPKIQQELESSISRLQTIRAERGTSEASKGLFADLEVLTKTPSDIPIIEFPEMLRIVKEITGKTPEVRSYLNQALGRAYSGKLEIKLQREIFKDPKLAAKVFAHEIGHIVDFLPQGKRTKTLLVGRILSLNNFMKQTFGELKDKKLRMELKTLSYEWRPLSGGIETTYRKKSAELYADAISVLLNDPIRFQNTAPTFWKAFFDNLDKKPSVKQALDDIWKMINEGEDKVFQKRDEELSKSFKKGEEAFTAKYLEKQKRETSFMYQLKLLFDDKNTPIIEKINYLRKNKLEIPAELNPDYALKGLLYSEGELKNYINDTFQPIFSKVQAIDDGWNRLGKIVFYERVINERGEFANPQGYDPKTAQSQLDKMKAESPEEWKILQEGKEMFRKAVQESVDYAEKNEYYTPELLKSMKSNPSYATFQVIDYLDTYITPRAYQQKGTLKDIANPATSTVMKLISMRKAIKRNNAKKMNIEFMENNFPTEIEVANTKWNGKSMDIKLPKDPDSGLVITIKEGKPQGYYVEKDIADMLNHTSNQILEALAKVSRAISQSRFYRPLFTVYNLGFQSFNFVRDLKRTWKNMPHKTLAEIPLSPIFDALKVAKGYGQAIIPSAKRVLNKPDMLIKEMENANILGLSYNDIYSGEIDPETSQIERILEQSGFLEKNKKKNILTPFHWVLDAVGTMGDFVETLPKVAGYIQLKGTMPKEKLAEFIRTSIGSPAFRVGGTATPISNNIFLFSNAIKEGIKSDIRVATGKKGKATGAGFWWKTVIGDFLPKFIMAAIAAGYFGEKLKKQMDQTSEYDKANYTIIPLGSDEKGRAIILRVPHDETGRFLGGLLWKMININKDKKTIADLFDLFSFGAGQFPNLSPSFTGVGALVSYLSGKNPYDSFRSRNIIPDTEFKAGPKYSFPIFFKWLMQNQGLGIFYPSYKPESPTDLEKMLTAPVMSNILGRWLKVTDYGETEQLVKTEKLIEQSSAERLLNERKIVNDAVKEYRKNPTEQNKKDIERRVVAEIVGDIKGADRKLKTTNTLKKIRIAILYKEVSPQMDSLINAGTNAEKVEKLLIIKNQISDKEFNELINIARRNKVISNNVINEYKKKTK